MGARNGRHVRAQPIGGLGNRQIGYGFWKAQIFTPSLPKTQGPK